MKKIVILCTVILLVLLPMVLVVGCQQETEPAPPPPEEEEPPPEEEAPPPEEEEPPPPPPPPPPELESLTYTNSEYGFSVEYPKDWEFEEGLMGAIVVFAGPLVGEELFMINMNIMIEELPEFPKITLEDYGKLGKMQLEKAMENYQEVEERDATIADLPAKVLTYTCDFDGTRLMQTQAYFLKENIVYGVVYTALPEFHAEHLDCLELVISSFKFE